MRITSVCYDDTDESPKELLLIKRSTYLLSPTTYPHKFHSNHFHLPVFKELAYLHPSHYQDIQSQDGVFFRLARTDSVHHSANSVVDLHRVLEKMQELGLKQKIIFSSELDTEVMNIEAIQYADPIQIHKDLASCKVFWGNSATMAAEAAVLGIPSIFVSAEKFAYISELESYGLLFYFHPDHLMSSLDKIDELLAGNPPADHFIKARKKLLEEKVDMTAFLIWFIEQLPNSARALNTDPAIARTFIAKQ
jgi:predicted glycosyltransferase